jgi:hypothetical protein
MVLFWAKYYLNSFRIPEFHPHFGHLHPWRARFDAEMLDDAPKTQVTTIFNAFRRSQSATGMISKLMR